MEPREVPLIPGAIYRISCDGIPFYLARLDDGRIHLYASPCRRAYYGLVAEAEMGFGTFARMVNDGAHWVAEDATETEWCLARLAGEWDG